MSVALVCVVSGEAYEKYAADMFHSAFEFFGPDPVVAHIALPGREGWPDATLYRYHVLLENERIFSGFDHIYLCDADMRFESPVGEEVLGKLVATEHPGYVRAPRDRLPYENSTASKAYVWPQLGMQYYCGGFVGGERRSFFTLARCIRGNVDHDEGEGVTATWHDESHLNAVLTEFPPTLVLPPSYCFPDDASGYALGGYERKLVALDKTPAERGAR